VWANIEVGALKKSVPEEGLPLVISGCDVFTYHMYLSTTLHYFLHLVLCYI
jgi:hypothetical protein